MSNRQYVFEYGVEPGEKTEVGWFNKDKAQSVDEPRRSDGVGLASGGEHIYERMWLSASNRWIVQIWYFGDEDTSTWSYIEDPDVINNWFYKTGLDVLEEKDEEPEEDDDETPESTPDPEPTPEPEEKPKRKRGRPRKNESESQPKLPTSEEDVAEEE